MTDHETMLCEAATCAWEHILPLIQLDGPWKELCEGIGTSALRMEVIELAPLIDADYNTVQDYPMSFDWDFVPDWITKNVTITETGLEVRPDREIPQ